MDYDIAYSVKVTCWVAIQVCVGRLPSGRDSHRTFRMKGIDPGASPEAIAEVVRALAPLLIYPITGVRKVVKTVRTMTFTKIAPISNIIPITQAMAIKAKEAEAAGKKAGNKTARLFLAQAGATAATVNMPRRLARPFRRTVCPARRSAAIPLRGPPP
jgi:hypothetical protein